jgi:hypothetical protein
MEAVYCDLWRVRAVLFKAWKGCTFTSRRYFPLAVLYMAGGFFYGND